MTGVAAVLPSITLAVISRQYLVRLGLQSILERSETIRIVMHPYQRMMPDMLLTEERPDAFVLDLETNRDAIDTIRQIRESAPTSKIVLLSGVEDGPRLHESFACGVDGVILTIQPPEVVLAVIESLYAPAHHYDAQVEHNGVVRVDLKGMSQRKIDSAAQPPPWPDALTQREQEVIQLVRQGLSNKEIAYQLSISDSTVRHHMTSIFDKVGVSNRQKLLVHCHQFRFPDLQPSMSR